MSGTVINLECRQLDADSVIQNGSWSTTLAKPVEIANGDILELNRVFIDNVSQSDGKVVIAEDIKATLSFLLYVSSIEHPGTSLINNGHYYIGHPERGTDPEHGVDGADYIACVNLGSDVYNAHMRYVTLVRVTSVHNFNNPNMGDETGEEEEQPLTLSYYDNNGNLRDSYFNVPWTPITSKGMTLNVEVSLLMDTSKGFVVKADQRNQWNGKEAMPYLPQNVDPDNIVIVNSSVPTVNYCHPIVIDRDILIPKGSYGGPDMVSLLNDALQSNHEEGQFDLGAANFPNNPLLKQGGSMPLTTYYVSNRSGKDSSRVFTPTNVNPVNFWVGSNQINLDYDVPSSKFFFKYLHFIFISKR